MNMRDESWDIGILWSDKGVEECTCHISPPCKACVEYRPSIADAVLLDDVGEGEYEIYVRKADLDHLERRIKELSDSEKLLRDLHNAQFKIMQLEGIIEKLKNPKEEVCDKPEHTYEMFSSRVGKYKQAIYRRDDGLEVKSTWWAIHDGSAEAEAYEMMKERERGLV